MMGIKKEKMINVNRNLQTLFIMKCTLKISFSWLSHISKDSGCMVRNSQGKRDFFA